VNPDTGLSQAEVDVSRREHGYNEVVKKTGHPVLMFLGKFWGLSAWMLELIMVLSVLLGKYRHNYHEPVSRHIWRLCIV